MNGDDSSQEDVLKCTLRKKILEAIQAGPGINQSALARQFSVHSTTIRYHEKPLIEAGLIIRKRKGRAICYYPKHMGKSTEDTMIRDALANLRNRRIVGVVLKRPRSNMSEVARKLGCVPSTVKRRVDPLVERGILVEISRSAAVELGIHPDVEPKVREYFEGRKTDGSIG